MSGQIVHLEPDAHVAVQKLLPWYLTDRLENGERADIDAHLAACPECRAELETERQWQLLQPGHDARADVEDGWARMRERLGTGTGAPAAFPSAGNDGASRRRRPRLAVPWQFGGGALPRAWAAPAMLSVALVLAIGFTLRPAPAVLGDYHVLAAPALDTGTAVVRFRADATEAQIRHSLNASGARLVDGPTVTDAYVVRLPRDRYATSLEKLRKEPGVALVEALETATPR